MTVLKQAIEPRYEKGWHMQESCEKPVSVAQLDARPTGDQEVAGSIPAGPAISFRGDWSWYIYYGHSLPSADSRRTVVIFWQKNVHNTG